MIDQTKVADARKAIIALASEYDRNGLPDVGNTLRAIAELTPLELTRLRQMSMY